MKKIEIKNKPCDLNVCKVGRPKKVHPNKIRQYAEAYSLLVKKISRPAMAQLEKLLDGRPLYYWEGNRYGYRRAVHSDLLNFLTDLQIPIIKGNDAPRKGRTGEFIMLNVNSKNQ